MTTNFSGANLREVAMRSANFFGADFRNANMEQADLRHANLLGANLRGAIVTGALMDGCQYDPCWKIVDGKFVHVDDLLSAKAEYDFAQKFEITSIMIDALRVVPANHHRDVLAAVCKKFGFKLETT